MSMTTSSRLDSPVLYEWNIDEHSSRYDYPRGQPSEDVLQILFSILAAINALVAFCSLVLILGILRSKRLRSSAFKLYVLFMAIPDFIGSFLCLLTCALSAPMSRYYSEAMCGFQSFYLVFAFAGNAWVNTVIVYEIHKLLTYSKNRRRYFPPTRRQVFRHVAIVYSYALIWGILAAFPIPGIPLHTKAYGGFACFPMEQDTDSTWFFYFAFLPGILLIPFFYTIYVMGKVVLTNMMPKVGTSRRVSLFMGRLVIVYFLGWLPFLILSFTGNFVHLNPWISWAGAAMSHFQGFISTTVVFYTSDDIRRQMLLVLQCNWNDASLGDSSSPHITSGGRATSKYSSNRFSSAASMELLDASGVAVTNVDLNEQEDFELVEELDDNADDGSLDFLEKKRHGESKEEIEFEMEELESGAIHRDVVFSSESKVCYDSESSLVITSPTSQNSFHRHNPKSEIHDMIDSQVELFSSMLKKIVVHRQRRQRMETNEPFQHTNNSTRISDSTPQGSDDSISAELSPAVKRQLRDLITTYSELFRENYFHNFEHACHVTTSANKLLQQIVGRAASEEARDHTYGLASDPVAQFAILFSTLTHDLDYTGINIQQLNKQENRLAAMHGGKSVAEQNSIDLAFEVLASPSYFDLIFCICANTEEYSRFKQLVINCLMATDLFDKEQVSQPNSRWERAFSFSDDESEYNDETSESDLKATIVIEHILQASDIAHTMQPWNVFCKWNEKLFAEMCIAYQLGRGLGQDPAKTWYEDELRFFDNHVIPLAQKLDECGIFGASSYECLKYALENRIKWEVTGKEVVDEYRKKYSGER